ncbi:hypothetical protein FM107_15995 [Sphingobacterium sp. JB170]|nr:hypothetical protein FM107_15995 [Sphingobacterium sp. JB170]
MKINTNILERDYFYIEFQHYAELTLNLFISVKRTISRYMQREISSAIGLKNKCI